MEEFSEVVFATRINAASGPFRYQENRFVEEGIYADKHFFNVFTYPLSSGDKNTALQEPFSIVLSRELANKYFGDENPIGKVISFRDEYNYKVTGIIESVPENSHLQYDYILSFSSYEAMGRKGVNRWGTINYCTYALLQNAVHHSEFDAKLSSIVDKYNQVRSEETRPSYFLQPLTSIHLESHLNFEMFENSDLRYVYIFTSIAFVILLIACINYMNLATARATKRYKEIGIRKAIGAKKLELIKQFLGESLFFTLLAMIISILWIWVVLPYFSTFVDRDIMFSENVNLINVFGMFVIVTIVGIISGIYPAFLLSSFKPVNVLKSAGAVRIKQSESTHVVI